FSLRATPPPSLSTLSLHDALPIYCADFHEPVRRFPVPAQTCSRGQQIEDATEEPCADRDIGQYRMQRVSEPCAVQQIGHEPPDRAGFHDRGMYRVPDFSAGFSQNGKPFDGGVHDLVGINNSRWHNYLLRHVADVMKREGHAPA